MISYNAPLLKQQQTRQVITSSRHVITGKNKPCRICLVTSWNWFRACSFRTTKMAAAAETEMNPITNIYGKPFTKILCLLPSALGVSVDDFRRTRLPPDHWIDTRKFLTRRRELPSGIFELFGNFSDESAYTVRNNMIQWIQDNRGNFEVWTSIIRRHKKQTLAEWIKWMVDEETAGDEIALFALARMYNRHVIVYTKKYHWTTVIHRVDVSEEEVAGWCDIHLLFIKPYVFGEIKRIRKPVATSNISTPVSKQLEASSVITEENVHADQVITGKDVITESVKSDSVIPENSGVAASRPSRKRTRTVIRLPAPPKIKTRSKVKSSSVEMRTRSSVRTAATSKVLSSGRCVKNVNYSDLDATKSEEPVPKKKTKRSYRATKEPSSARLAAHQKIIQEREKHKELNKNTTKKDKPEETHENKLEDDKRTDTQKQQEEVAVDVLLALGEQLPENQEDALEENAQLMPIGGGIPADQTQQGDDAPANQHNEQPHDEGDERTPATSSNTQDTAEADTAYGDNNAGAIPKSVNTKGTFTMKRHVLPKHSSDPRKFRCPFDGCERSTNTAGELNAHYRRRHPPVACSICGREFDTPSSLNKHKYTHSAPSHVCDHCGECFHFKSQYDSHVRKHLKTPSFQCMSSGCGKWFKRKGELNAHLVVHSGEIFKCEEEGCEYSTNDPRNLRAHLRSHSDAEPFKCIYCGEGHRYEEQKKRHIKRCPLNPKNVKDKDK